MAKATEYANFNYTLNFYRYYNCTDVLQMLMEFTVCHFMSGPSDIKTLKSVLIPLHDDWRTQLSCTALKKHADIWTQDANKNRDARITTDPTSYRWLTVTGQFQM
jgi:hypothetical protein